MTEFSDASETVPEQAPAGGGALPSPEEQLLAGIARAAAQHKVSVLSPVGAQRTGALVVLREFAEALVNGDAVAARRVLAAVEAEPKGDAPAIAHVIGVGASVLDDWFTDAALERALAVAPIARWEIKQARSVASDLVGLARRGRAFASLEALRRRRSGPLILEGVALGLAAAAAARAGRQDAAVENVLAEALVDDEAVAAARASMAAQAVPAGSSFVRSKAPQSPRPAASAPTIPLEDPRAARFEAWLAEQETIAAPNVADELGMLGRMRELGRLRGLDLAEPDAVAPFVELLHEVAVADTGELEQNALATLRDYADFRLDADATADTDVDATTEAEAWRAARVTVERALRRGAGASALRRVLAEADAVEPELRRAALAGLALITGVDPLLDWIGRSKEIDENGAIRAEDQARVAEMLGHGTSPEASAASLVSEWWTALSYAGIVETGASRARRGPNAAEWAAAEWASAEAAPLGLAEQIVAIFVAETLNAPLVGGQSGGKALATAAIGQLLRIIGSKAGASAAEGAAEASAEAGSRLPALQHLVAAGLVQRSDPGADQVPAALRGPVARGLFLAMEFLTADASGADADAGA